VTVRDVRVKRTRLVGTHVRHTRSSVLKRAVAEYEALNAIVKRLRPADFGRYVFDERAPARWTVKDVIAHLTAWKLRDVRRISRDRSPLKAYDAPYDPLANRRIYERSHRTPAKTIVAEHRAAHREMLKALRDAPADRFAKRHSPHWPADLVGHVGSHRRMHLDPLFMKPPEKR
jgi:DinB family protein